MVSQTCPCLWAVWWVDGGPQKTCPEPVSVSSFGKGGFADVIKLKILRSSWIPWVSLHPMTSVLARDRREDRKGGGHGRTEADWTCTATRPRVPEASRCCERLKGCVALMPSAHQT